MTAQTIEKLDKARYNAWLMQTVGFALFIGIVIFLYLTQENYPGFFIGGSAGLVIAEAVGVLLFLIGTVWKSVVFRQIRSDSKSREALNNELYIQYGYKTYMWGFWGFLLSLLILMFVTDNVDLTATTICLVAIYAGVLTRQVSTLIYYRK